MNCREALNDRLRRIEESNDTYDEKVAKARQAFQTYLECLKNLPVGN